jgi:hypothetical protein
MGASEATLAKARADAERLGLLGAVAEAGLRVHPDNVRAVKLLLAMGTQWLTASLSTTGRAVLIRTGLRYEVLDRVAAWSRLGEVEADDFGRLRVLEVEALTAWAQERASAT